MFKELMGDTIQEMLNGELDDKLGYDKYDQSNKHIDNSRNGFSEKSMRSEIEPQIINKYIKRI